MKHISSSFNFDICRFCILIIVILSPSLIENSWLETLSQTTMLDRSPMVLVKAECSANHMNRMTRAHLRYLRKGGPYSQLADLIRTHNDCLIREDKLRFKKSNLISQMIEPPNEMIALFPIGTSDKDFSGEDKKEQDQQNEEANAKVIILEHLLQEFNKPNIPKHVISRLRQKFDRV